MTDRALPSPEFLRKIVSYDPLTGHLFWLPRDADAFHLVRRTCTEKVIANWNARYAGRRAFCQINADGYLVGKLFGRAASAHRVAFALTHLRWPEAMIDHINGDKTDNRIANLREVDNQANLRNAKRPVSNTSGRVGVSRIRTGSWSAQIRVDRRHIHLGSFRDKQDAIDARAAAEVRYGFHANHGRSP